MKRIDGFLDLDEYFKNNNSVCDIRECDNYYQYWLRINNEEYFFKFTHHPYTELIAYEVANFLGMKAVFYDLAIFEEVKGVISKSYRREKCKYVSGSKILRDYLRLGDNLQFLKDMGLKEKNYFLNIYMPSDINNLEVIWQAIQQRYIKLGIPIDIEQIMSDFVNLFIFNILTLQNDGLPHNWELEESPNGVSLVPIYDNEYCFNFKKDNSNCKLTTNFRDNAQTNYLILEEFLKISSQEYIELFLEKFNLFTKEAFLELIKNVEDRINSKIPRADKITYINAFEVNRMKIEEVLTKLNLNQNVSRT